MVWSHMTREIAINTARCFVHECKLNGLKFHKVLIFGSIAKDKIHEGSDIDLLLISDQFGDNLFENLKLYSKINIRPEYSGLKRTPILPITLKPEIALLMR